jgi:hypothetical protein
MSEQDPLEEINPLLRPAVEAIIVAMAGAFDDIFTRPDAPAIVEAFLDDRLEFHVARDGVLIVERAGDRLS